MSSRYSAPIVIVQGSSRPSTYGAPRSPVMYSSPYPQTTLSMDSSSASQSTTGTRYRSGRADNYYVEVKEVPSSRGGPGAVVIQHNRPNPDNNEPSSSDRYSSGSRK
ncbi:hypothetical protein C7999DRAFT_15397 [Corynascus novoguineensis]|uniref:Uncharacterized protein n=1 Tax=Corynascus novoguineensis TaxID=1126955 RepID=A0AAN7HEG8_9PEZI|nr:hypothetical protein C7999DRAFT_15397 [Corynascus novoguineensis]